MRSSTESITAISRLMRIRAVHRRRPMRLTGARQHLCTILFACICVGSCSEIASRARQEKDEAKAAQTLRDVRSAQRTFKTRQDRFGTLVDLVEAGLLRLPPADTTSAAYKFNGSATGNSYVITATPTTRDDASAYVGWAFFLDESGIIRGTPYGKNNGYRVASKSDQPIRQQ
jgi:hypothetical protein